MDGKWTERVRKRRHAGQCNGYIKINSRQKKKINSRRRRGWPNLLYIQVTNTKRCHKKQSSHNVENVCAEWLERTLWCYPTLQKGFRATEISPGELEEKLAQRQVREEIPGVGTGQPQSRWSQSERGRAETSVNWDIHFYSIRALCPESGSAWRLGNTFKSWLLCDNFFCYCLVTFCFILILFFSFWDRSLCNGAWIGTSYPPASTTQGGRAPPCLVNYFPYSHCQ